MNTLYYGDNLHVLRTHMEDESVDLVYLDPPFNSGEDYNHVFKSKGDKQAAAVTHAFTDTWKWDDVAKRAYHEITQAREGTLAALKLADTMKAFHTVLGGEGSTLAYLSMMAPRLVELHRCLKPTGSLVLHCDPSASHYLKMLLDGIFGMGNFRNEIVWKRTSAHNDPGRFGSVHDVLLFYGKHPTEGTWNTIYTPYDESYLKSHYGQADPDGRRFRSDNLTGPGVSKAPSGEPWRGVDPGRIGRCWSVPKYLRASLGIPAGVTPVQALDALDDAGRILWPKGGGMPAFKRYLNEMPGVPCQDIWTDIPPLNSQAAERLHYPTQKPLALLERIIKALTNEGDTVLDPFAGCGTCIDASITLKRNWVGIDVTHIATNVIKQRLSDVQGLTGSHRPNKDYLVIGEPADLAGAEQLAEEDPHQFQTWALGLVGARTEAGPAKKGGDKGIDGVMLFAAPTGDPVRCLISVKGGQMVSSGMIRDLRGTMEREKAALGLLITLKSTSGMKAEASKAGFYESEDEMADFIEPIPRIQIATIEDLLEGRLPMFPPEVGTRDKTFKKGKRTSG